MSDQKLINHVRKQNDALRSQLNAAHEREHEYRATIARLSGEMNSNPTKHLNPAERDKIHRIRDAYQYDLTATLHDWDNLPSDIVNLCDAALAELDAREELAKVTAKVEAVTLYLRGLLNRQDLPGFARETLSQAVKVLQ